MAVSEENRQKAVALNMFETMFSMTAFLLMFIGSLRCDFVKFTDTSGLLTEPPSLQFGIWRYQSFTAAVNVDGLWIFETCHGYPDYQEIDPTWKTAQAFAVMSFIMGVIVLVASCIFACSMDRDDNFVTRSWLAPAMYFTTALFQGLSLLLLASNACKDNAIVQLATKTSLWATFPDTCSLNKGANLIISATVFWFAAGLASAAARWVGRSPVAEGGEEAAKAKEGEDVEAPVDGAEEKPEQARAS